MQNTMRVAIFYALHQLGHELLDNFRTQPKSVQMGARSLGQCLSATALSDRKRLHVFLEVQIEKFEDEIELVAVGVHNIEELHNVWIVHLFEQRNFANGCARHAFILGFKADLLEGDNTLVGGGQVAGFVDDSVCAWDWWLAGSKIQRWEALADDGAVVPSPTFSSF
jgi:hypothetical protein